MLFCLFVFNIFLLSGTANAPGSSLYFLLFLQEPWFLSLWTLLRNLLTDAGVIASWPPRLTEQQNTDPCADTYLYTFLCIFISHI